MTELNVSKLAFSIIFIPVCLIILLLCGFWTGKWHRRGETNEEGENNTEQGMEIEVLSVENFMSQVSRIPETSIKNENQKNYNKKTKSKQKEKRQQKHNNIKNGRKQTQKRKKRDQATSSTSLEEEIQKNKKRDQATSTTSLAENEKNMRYQATSSRSLVDYTEKNKKRDQATSTTSLAENEKNMRDQATSSTSLVDYTKASQEQDTKPKGLCNLGNTCFMNAMLQNLVWCPKLQTDLEEAQLNEFCKMSNSVLKLLKYTHSNESNDSGYKPSDILLAAMERNSIFDGYRQQDSFEMFNTIIDAIKEEMQQLTQKKDTNVFEKSVEELIMGNSTGVRLFFGTFVAEFQYSSCEHVECVFQRFSSITVPIVKSEGKKHNNRNKNQNNKKSTGIERGMKHGLMQTEIFEEEDFPCQKCDHPGTGGKCKKTMLIFESPSIMVIHIDRFRENGKGGLVKRNNLVTYPETFDIGQFCSQVSEVTEADRKLCYSLFGVVAHSGNLDSGHYVAFIKTTQRSPAGWYEQMNRSWRDPEKCKMEVVRKLEELKQKESTFQSNPDREYREFPIQKEQTAHAETEWYYISDNVVKSCKSDQAIDNTNAYVLMYEKL